MVTHGLIETSVSIIATIETQIRADAAITVEKLGGVAAMAAEADALLKAPYLDVLVLLAATAGPDDWATLDALTLRGFQESSHVLPFRDATNILIENKVLRTRIGKKLQPIFVQRINERQDNNSGLIAAYALEALFRLSLIGTIDKYQTLGIMAGLGSEINGLFAQHAAKLTGAAFHVWRESDLLDTLGRLRINEDAEGEAEFELGLVYLVRALEKNSLREILEGLEFSQTFFFKALQTDERRSDAIAYFSSIELIKLFATDAPAKDLSIHLRALTEAIADRSRLLQIGSLPLWLKPRQDRDIQWVKLLRVLESIARNLERPSWLNAWTIMTQLLAVYDAEHTIFASEGLNMLFRPRIEAAFIREKGLLNHLDELMFDPCWQRAHSGASKMLRARIDELKKGGGEFKGLGEAAQYPLLQQALQDDSEIGNLPAEIAEQLEAVLGERTRKNDKIAHPIVQKILSELRSALVQCSDYKGIIQDDFDDLILQVILFCKDRQDAGLKEMGARGEYLRSGKATEFQFQADLREWLAGNFLSGDIRSEVEGVATGRADIYVGFGAHRFTIELKRHHGMVNGGTVGKYIGQAGSYQGTNVKLGMLGILELAKRDGPPASLEECIWYEADIPSGAQVARHLVVFRVPGMLQSPSTLSVKPRKFQSNEGKA